MRFHCILTLCQFVFLNQLFDRQIDLHVTSIELQSQESKNKGRQDDPVKSCHGKGQFKCHKHPANLIWSKTDFRTSLFSSSGVQSTAFSAILASL